jgi:hypothetical protein
VYREDASGKDQGWTLLDGGSVPLLSDKDDLTVTDVVAAVVSTEDMGTCRAPSK